MAMWHLLRWGGLILTITVLLAGCSELVVAPSTAVQEAPTATPTNTANTTGGTSPSLPPPTTATSGTIVFAALRDGGVDLFSISPAGTRLTRLTEAMSGTETLPRWSPDGTQLAYLSDADGVMNLYLLDLETLSSTRLTDSTTPIRSATWNPSGTTLAYLSALPTTNTNGNQEPMLGLYLFDLERGSAIILRRDMQGCSDLAWSPDGEQIAFSCPVDGTQDILMARVNGSQTVTNITNSTSNDSQPAWSRDGQRIAFVSDAAGDADIYVMLADGTARTRLTESTARDTAPTWSPDGSQIAFVSDRSGSPQLYRVSDSGTDVTPLAEALTGVQAPAWQPPPPLAVTNRLAFAAGVERGFADLYIINTTGASRVQVTNDPGFDAITPAWSPDATQLAFAGRDSINYDIYVQTVTGGAPVRLTEGQGSNMHPAWSPDGQRIGFETNRDGNWEIYTINPSGSDLTNLSNHPANDGNIAWSPDGQQIAFVSDRDGNLEIYVINVDGSDLRRLTNSPANDVFPAWSPDSSMLVFRSNRNGNNEIYRMDANGTRLRRLTNSPANDDQPVWSPDGQQIAFISNRAPDATSNRITQNTFDLYLMDTNGGSVELITSSGLNKRYPAWQPLAATAQP